MEDHPLSAVSECFWSDHARRPSSPSVIWGHSIPFFTKSTISQAGCTYQNTCCDILHIYALLKQFKNHFFPHKISLSIHYLIRSFKFLQPKRSKSTCSEFSRDKFHTWLSDVIISCIRVKPHSSLLSRKKKFHIRLFAQYLTTLPLTSERYYWQPWTSRYLSTPWPRLRKRNQCCQTTCFSDMTISWLKNSNVGYSGNTV